MKAVYINQYPLIYNDTRPYILGLSAFTAP